MNIQHGQQGNQHEGLAQLAALSGINLDWWDSLGNHHDVSEATLRHLLAGLGVLDDANADDAALDRDLHRERHASWHRLIPTVRTLYISEASGIELVVDKTRLGESWQWSIVCENGEQLQTTFEPGELGMAGHEGGGVGDSRIELDGQELELRWLALPPLPVGYHRVAVATGQSKEVVSAHLIVAPRRCHELTQGPEVPRFWGFSVQLYALRSTPESGIGDFGDLALALEATHSLGGDLLGINPLHVLFAHAPEDASPYSPSSRVFLNPWYIDVAQAPGYSLLDEKQRQASVPSLPEKATFVDYTCMATHKLAVLETVYAHFDALATSHDDQQAFVAWQTAQGDALQRFATFELLRELDDSGPAHGNWRRWPDEWQDPESAVIADLATQHAARIRFYVWLQWVAAQQLNSAAERAQELGLAIGLYRDLAVGIAANGADAWADSKVYIAEVHVGAPPDEFSVKGQDWGLPPMNPRALRERGYAPFRDMLRANMQAAGALRIDHVMGLARLFMIPAGSSPTQGAYVASHLDEMLAVLAIESTRARCLIIGEDLGTVPDGFRERLLEAGVLSYRLLYFEKHYDGDRSFKRPHDYARQALVGANTHDLPTLAGFWMGSDISLRTDLNLFPSETLKESQLHERDADRRRLLSVLKEQDLLPEGIDPDRPDLVEMTPVLINAIHRYLARSNSCLLAVNIEDVLGEREQMNLPGTDRDRYPNWRRRPPLPVNEWADSERFVETARLIRQERP